MKTFDAATEFALQIALEIYDAATQDVVTAPAAFGVACLILQDMLRINLRAAALLLDVALDRRKQS
jgi:hypothetical protein